MNVSVTTLFFTFLHWQRNSNYHKCHVGSRSMTCFDDFCSILAALRLLTTTGLVWNSANDIRHIQTDVGVISAAVPGVGGCIK